MDPSDNLPCQRRSNIGITRHTRVVVVDGDALGSFDDLRPFPVDHRVGRRHRLDHERRRHVGHERKHEQHRCAETPPVKIKIV